MVQRVDYNISDKSTLYGRYALYSENDFPGTINASPYVGYETGQTNYNQNVTINYTRVFTPNFVSSSKVIYNRLNQKQPRWVQTRLAPRCTLRRPRFRTCRERTGRWSSPGLPETTPGNAIPFGGPRTCISCYEDLMDRTASTS